MGREMDVVDFFLMWDMGGDFFSVLFIVIFFFRMLLF